MSPMTSKTRSSRSASSVIFSMKGFRTIDLYILRRKLGHRLVVCFFVDDFVVKDERVFHKRDALAFDRVADDDLWLAARRREQCLLDLFVVVTIHTQGEPTERLPFIFERFKFQDLLRFAHRLPFVAVDEYREIVELMVGADERAFP